MLVVCVSFNLRLIGEHRPVTGECFTIETSEAFSAYARAMQIEVRPWQPSDRLAAWSVLREASFSNLWPSFLIAVRRPASILMFLVVIATCIMSQASALITLLSLACFVCVVYCGCAVATLYFLYGPNFNDMKKMESTYFSSPDDHFWVAQVGEEIVGTIAVIKKPETAGADESGTAKRNNSFLTETIHKRRNRSGPDASIDSSPKIAWLRRMAVKKQCRGHGIAKRLVKVVIDFCKGHNYDAIFLITTEVHQPARILYMNQGFKQKAFKPYKHLGGFIDVWTYEFEMLLTK